MFMILGMNKNQEIYNKTINIRFQGELIERVKEMRYLGSIITDNLKSCSHIKSRKRSFMFGYITMNKCGMESEITPSDIKLCYYKTYIRPLLYYAIENTSLTKSDLFKIQVIESTMVKRMFGLKKFNKSGLLLRACNIESTKNKYEKIKVQFGRRIMKNEFTKILFETILENDTKTLDDKNSLAHQLCQIANRANCEAKTLNEIIDKAEIRSKLSKEIDQKLRTLPKVCDVMDALNQVKNERKTTLESLLYVKFKRPTRLSVA